jgi:hypothetical protein
MKIECPTSHKDKQGVFFKKSALWMMLALLFTTMQGCLIVPYPHTRVHHYVVRGRLIDENGTPVPNAMVVEFFKGSKTVTDENGCFAVRPLVVRHWVCFWSGHTSWISLLPGMFAYPASQECILVYAEGFPEHNFTIHSSCPCDEDYYRQAGDLVLFLSLQDGSKSNRYYKSSTEGKQQP